MKSTLAPKTVIIVQARMASTRLPGKVMKDLAGKTVLERVLDRLEDVGAEEVVVATTAGTEDQPIVELAKRKGLRVVRGPSKDVLARYVQAARESQAERIIRITSDCPLVDAGVVRLVAERLGQMDFSSNSITRTFPQGLDTEVFPRDTLERVARLAQSPQAREHVCWYIYREKPELFLIRDVRDAEDNSMVRWTLDTQADLERIQGIYERGADMPFRQILRREMKLVAQGL